MGTEIPTMLSGSTEGRREGGGTLDPHEELDVLQKRSIKDLPSDDAELIERIGLLRRVEVARLHVVEHDLPVGPTTKDKGRVDRQVTRRGRGSRGRLRDARSGDDDRLTRGKLG